MRFGIGIFVCVECAVFIMWRECHFRWKLVTVSIKFWSRLAVTPMASDLNCPLSLEIGGIFRNICSKKSLEISITLN